MTAAEAKRRLGALARAESRAALQRFFKTGPGEYGEGDVFIGVRLPELRAVCRECRGLAFGDITVLLRSRIHEERLLALLILVDTFRRGDEPTRRKIYQLYLSHTRFINNWDLVDTSAASIVGAWLEHHDRSPLRRLARSTRLWERRIAIIATLWFIKRDEFTDTFAIAKILLDDDHDLIHKAVGWMLREVGNRDGGAERRFLASRYKRMPRTMLRYAIEKFPERERRGYLTGTV